MDMVFRTYAASLSDLLRQVTATDQAQQPLDLDAACERLADWAAERHASGGRIYAIGNGGSSCIAMHLQMDLCNACGIRAQVFDLPPVVTALANDHGYPSVFERPLALFADPSDLLVAISSSGQSENILRAVRMAQTRGCRVATFSGFRPDNPLRALGDINFHVPSMQYGHVELAHGVLAHQLTDRLLAGAAGVPPTGQAFRA